ncbi:MAG: uracil-DNA glycosylase [Pseudomonadota bacterium]
MTATNRVKLESSWQRLLSDEFTQPYMQTLSRFLRQEKQRGRRIYPPGDLMFAALDQTPVERVKVVIIGQDPYHGAGQAHGLSFSVRPGTALPPSLVNIFKEINDDLKLAPELALGKDQRGCLNSWAAQGVLLLNAVLSVEHGRAASHQNKGWETFTDAVVTRLAAHKAGLVFLLWGSYAQKKGRVVDRNRHCVLQAPHPSPLSAHRGFFGCRHFSQANAYLREQGHDPIDWHVVE